MKNGTLYAKKLKKAMSRIRGSAGQVSGETTDAIEQLLVAVLSQETSVQRAERAMRQLRDDMVDFNELRVSSPAEVSGSIQQHVPNPVHRAKSLLSILNAIYRKQYAVSLDGLANRGVREVKNYLDSLEGMTPYVSAYLLLWCLGGHAIPVNNVTLEALRREDLVDGAAEVGEVQAFLERHISAADAREFARDLEAYAASAGRSSGGGAAKRAVAKSAAQRKPRGQTSRKTGGTSASRSSAVAGSRKPSGKATSRRK